VRILRERLIQPKAFFLGSFDVFALKAHQNRLRLRFTIPAGLPKVFIDPTVLARVFYTLVDRAVMVTQQGKVDVRVGLRGGRLVVVVEDEGPAMKPRDVAMLFTDSSPDTELRTVAGLVRMIRGDLTVTNEGRPCGLHVKLTVPIKMLQSVLM